MLKAFLWQTNSVEESESSDDGRPVKSLGLSFRNDMIKSIMRIITLEMKRNKDLGNDNPIYIGDKLNVGVEKMGGKSKKKFNSF